MQLIANDSELVASVVQRSLLLASESGGSFAKELNSTERRLHVLNARIDDLFELSGNGTKEDRAETQSRITEARAERAAVQMRVDRLRATADGASNTLSAEKVATSLLPSSTLLRDAAAGLFGNDGVFQALAIFRAITTKRIHVHVDTRPNRKRTVVRGTFTSSLVTKTGALSSSRDVEVWIRKPPRLDLIAQRVHELIDVQGLSHRETTKVLRHEGHSVNSGNVWYSYRRWYEIQGLPVPSVPYNNGKPRRNQRNHERQTRLDTDAEGGN